MVPESLPKNIKELNNIGYRVLPIREELRNNLMAKIRADEIVFPGIVGFEDTVLPQVENAILAGQDIILLGERGQAKSRLVRSLVNLLDEFVPIVEGCEINDNPFEPVCRACRDKIADSGDDTSLEWISRDRRYSEKLATPDISIADLIGEIDPIKVAEGLHLSDELAIHYGLVAAMHAWQDSGMEVTDQNSESIGVAIGSGIGGLSTLSSAQTILNESGL